MFKRMIMLSLAVILLGIPVQAADWDFDKAHSNISFSVRHMVISKVKGSFTDFEGQAQFDGRSLETGSAAITIQVLSIDTDNKDRDEHLQGPDFFDAMKYPTMTFKSKKIVPAKDGAFTMTGDLTIKGVTHEVALDGEFNGVINDPWGNTRAGFSASTKINRQDFNMAWSNQLKDGSLIVGDDIDIHLEIELVKARTENAE
ncbi:MAG: polyisoprenoid-binding protein [FCB group bacterium]|nr:polyisoprenoid-binding protein [FCB group bacterium]